MKNVDMRKVMFWLSLLITVELMVGQGGAVSLTNLVPDAWIPTIKGWSTVLATLGTAIMTALSAPTSPYADRLAPPKSTTAAVLVAVALALALLFGGAGQAQAAPVPMPANPLARLMAQVEGIKADTIAGVLADIAAADADAGTLINPQDATSFKDPIAHACYPAATKFLQSLPAASALAGKFVGVQVFQRKRDFVAQLKAGLPVYLKLGCAPLLGDEVQSFIRLMALVGVSVSAPALAPLLPAAVPIALPALLAP